MTQPPDLPPAEAVDDLIDCLIANWSGWEDESTARYYLDELVFEIGRSPFSCNLPKREEELVQALSGYLTAEEWREFPARVRCRVDAWRQGCRNHALSGNLADWIKKERDRRRSEDVERRRREETERARFAAIEEKRRRLELAQEVAELKRRREALAERKRAALEDLKGRFKSDYLRASAETMELGTESLLSREDVEWVQAEVVRDWAARMALDDLDDEQIAAVASAGTDLLVAARAGSGKTRTISARALFLIQHCGVDPSEILLLAFNRAAAAEMASRIGKHVEVGPYVMTFHALAYATTHPEEDLIFDNELEAQFGRSSEIQEVIDEHIRSTDFAPAVRELMLAYFREDWDAIIDGGHDLGITEFIERRRMVAKESLAGEYVKSYGEKLIANTLFEHGIDYKYERNFRWGGNNYRPDFILPWPASGSGPKRKGGIVIEYFGLQGDPDYDERSEEKRGFWGEMEEWTLLEYTPRDVASGGRDAFTTRLLGDLGRLNVLHSRLSEEEIWELVKGRAVDSFSKAMGAFLGRCRKRDLSPDALEQEIELHTPLSRGEELFLFVALSVYRRYLERLKGRGLIDFDGLIWKAVKSLNGGETRFSRRGGRENGDLARLRFVMVDEFQDFSEMFFALAREVRGRSKAVEFFCVGDDWQAINGFAGSELRFFRDFEQYFPGARRLDLRTNYRSAASIVRAGNALMAGRGKPAEALVSNRRGSVAVARMNEFEPTAQEQGRGNGDEVTFAVLRLVRSFLDRGLSVALLSRRNSVPWYIDRKGAKFSNAKGLELLLERLQSKLPDLDRDRVEVSTAHRYKGREGDAVIVLDAVQRSYPLIHPHWQFMRLHGDSPEKLEEEERRLFYVAITRARQELVLISDRSQESPFLRALAVSGALGRVEWHSLKPVAPLDGEWLEVRVAKAFEVKDQLKKLGYQWQGKGREYWRRAFPAEGFDFSTLLEQSWAIPGVRIEVYSEAQELLHSRLPLAWP